MMHNVSRFFGLTLVLAAIGSTAAACSSSDVGTGKPVTLCVPGATQACTCSDGTSGSQACSPDGSEFLNCVCSTKPCSASNPGGTCASGQTCVAGACCAVASACGANCCAAGTTCVNDGTGTKVCAQTCTASGQCPAAKGCCALLADGKSGACFPNNTVAGQQCLCGKPSDCSSGICGETTDSLGNPAGAWVCQPNDGKPYHGCKGSTSCIAGYCCITLSFTGTTDTSPICELPCQNSSQCGGVATCSKLTSGTCSGSPGSCQ